MAQSKKYNYRVFQDNDAWTAEITRRVTSRVTTVSKGKGGFATEAEAEAWAQAEVEAFLKKTNLGEMEKRRAKNLEDEKKLAVKIEKAEKRAEEETEEQAEEPGENQQEE